MSSYLENVFAEFVDQPQPIHKKVEHSEFINYDIEMRPEAVLFKFNVKGIRRNNLHILAYQAINQLAVSIRKPVIWLPITVNRDYDVNSCTAVMKYDLLTVSVPYITQGAPPKEVHIG